MFRSRRNTLVKRLWKFRVNNETKSSSQKETMGSEDMELKSVTQAFFKRLKEWQLEALLQAMESKSGETTPCVPVVKSELRLGRHTVLPYFLCCKVFRWPNLTNDMAMKRLPCCSKKDEHKETVICCNPYHWSLVVSIHEPPIVHFPTSPTFISGQSFNEAPIIESSGSKRDPAFSQDSGFQLSNCQDEYFLETSQSENSEADQESCWCNIAYWEHNKRVGRLFPVTSPSVRIFQQIHHGDGMCLGLFQQPTNNEAVRRTREKIGFGIILSREAAHHVNSDECSLNISHTMADVLKSQDLSFPCFSQDRDMCSDINIGTGGTVYHASQLEEEAKKKAVYYSDNLDGLGHHDGMINMSESSQSIKTNQKPPLECSVLSTPEGQKDVGVYNLDMSCNRGRCHGDSSELLSEENNFMKETKQKSPCNISPVNVKNDTFCKVCSSQSAFLIKRTDKQRYSAQAVSNNSTLDELQIESSEQIPLPDSRPCGKLVCASNSDSSFSLQSSPESGLEDSAGLSNVHYNNIRNTNTTSPVEDYVPSSSRSLSLSSCTSLPQCVIQVTDELHRDCSRGVCDVCFPEDGQSENAKSVNNSNNIAFAVNQLPIQSCMSVSSSKISLHESDDNIDMDRESDSKVLIRSPSALSPPSPLSLSPSSPPTFFVNSISKLSQERVLQGNSALTNNRCIGNSSLALSACTSPNVMLTPTTNNTEAMASNPANQFSTSVFLCTNSVSSSPQTSMSTKVDNSLLSLESKLAKRSTHSLFTHSSSLLFSPEERNKVIWAYNASDYPIFVNSPTLVELGSPRSLVVKKVPPGHSIKVFDYARAALLEKSVLCSKLQQEGPFETCSVRISMGKGWGPHYSRQFITSCPCWLELWVMRGHQMHQHNQQSRQQ